MLLDELADRQAVGRRLVVGELRDVLGRLGQPLAQQALEQPVAAQDRAGARRARLLRQDRAQGQHAAAAVRLDAVHPTPLGAVHARDAVMLRQRLVQECVVRVDQFEHRAVAGEQVGEEPDGLLVQVGADLGEGREVPLALLVVGVEVADLQPLAGELGGQAAGPLVADHPPRLRGQHVGVVEPARGGQPRQLVVGHRGPEEIAEPAGELPVRDRLRLGPGAGPLDAVEERRRDQDPGQHQPERLVMRGAYSPRSMPVQARSSFFSRASSGRR